MKSTCWVQSATLIQLGQFLLWDPKTHTLDSGSLRDRGPFTHVKK